MSTQEATSEPTNLKTGWTKISGAYLVSGDHSDFTVWVERDQEGVEHIMTHCDGCEHEEELAGPKVAFVSSTTIAQWDDIIDGPGWATFGWVILLTALLGLGAVGGHTLIVDWTPNKAPEWATWTFLGGLALCAFGPLVRRVHGYLKDRRAIRQREFAERWADEFFKGGSAEALAARGRLCTHRQGYKVLKNAKLLMLPRK